MSRLTGIAYVENKKTIRVRAFIDGTHLEEAILVLNRESFTGRVIVDMSQGGICKIQAEDKAAPEAT